MKVLISEKAKFQLRESAHFYETRKAGLGKKLISAIRKKIKFIVKNPLATEIKYDDVHVSFLTVFPFSIHYIYEKEKTTIFVSAIFHTSQNPEKL